jgi:hypothetical protein
MPIPSEAARRLDNDRPHTVALDPLKHGGEAGRIRIATEFTWQALATAKNLAAMRE